MADWYGSARSNYFRVKDRNAFEQLVDSIGELELITGSDGSVGLLSKSDKGDWPIMDSDSENGEAPSLFQRVAEHLQEEFVAIFMEVGAEKLRYLTGHAIAINSKGETVEVSLEEIYKRAAPLGNSITKAEF